MRVNISFDIITNILVSWKYYILNSSLPNILREIWIKKYSKKYYIFKNIFYTSESNINILHSLKHCKEYDKYPPNQTLSNAVNSATLFVDAPVADYKFSSLWYQTEWIWVSALGDILSHFNIWYTNFGMSSSMYQTLLCINKMGFMTWSSRKV